MLKLRHFSQKRSLQQSHFRGRKHIGFLDSKKWSSPVQHVDVCVILPAFCGFMVSGELLQQLGAFRASCRNPKNRIATRSNAWIWRAHFWSRLLLKKKLKTASKWPCPKRKVVARGNPIFGSVEPWNLATCSKHEALYITQINQSWVLFKQQAFNATVRQILILDLQLQVWSLEAQTSTIPLCRNADVGILHRNCKSEHHKPLLKHL